MVTNLGYFKKYQILSVN